MEGPAVDAEDAATEPEVEPDLRAEADAASPAPGAADLSGTAYVIAMVAEVWSGPSEYSAVVDQVYANQMLTVHLVVNGWARISADGCEARWVNQQFLSKRKLPAPKHLTIPAKYWDERIEPGAIPETAGAGLTEFDVLLLWRGAKYLLDTGQCSSITYADKSRSEVDTFFVHDGSRNVFFTAADITQ